MFTEIHKSGKITIDSIDRFKKIESYDGLSIKLYLSIKALVDELVSLIMLWIIRGKMFLCFAQILKYRET